jgi:hypothetical protein
MLNTLSLLAALLALSTGSSAPGGGAGEAGAAQERKAVTTADFAGTWNIEVMSHQIALVIEPQEGNKVTATMMAMGRDTLLKGELVDRTLTLVGVKPEADAGPATHDAATHDAGPATHDAAAHGADAARRGPASLDSASSQAAAHAAAEPGAGHQAHEAPGPKPITATLQDDGTLAGEMMTNAGPAKWTGEKLKKRKG